MKIGSWEIPPRKIESVEEELPRLYRPEAVPLRLVHASPEELEEALESKLDAWNEYSTQEDVFISDEKRALREAKNRAVEIAREMMSTEDVAEKQKLADSLEDQIESINGPLGDALEMKIRSNIIRKLTPAEQKAVFVETVAEIENEKQEEVSPNETVSGAVETIPTTSEVQEAPEKGNTEVLPAADIESKKESVEERVSRRRIEREQRAEEFAKKFGIEDSRVAMLEAEKEYADAVRDLHTSTSAIGRTAFGKKIPAEVQEKYDAARLAWRTNLGKVAEGADTKDKIVARFIGIRDTAIRPADARTAAMREALDEKGKKLHNKALLWGTNSALGILGAVNIGTQKIGEGLARIQSKTISRSNEDFDQKKAAEQYARSTRILGGALIATVATGGFGGAAMLAWRLGRGALSTFGGAAAGAFAGKIFSTTAGANRQKALLGTLRDTTTGLISDADALAEETKLYERGNAQAREAARRKVEMYTTLAVAGTASITSAEILSHSSIGHLPSVQKSLDTVHELKASTVQTLQGESVSTGRLPNIEGTGPANFNVGATIHTAGEGTGTLFEELKSSIQNSNLYDSAHQTPGLKHFLETNPNTLSREVGNAFGEKGMRTVMGDQFFVDDNQNIWYDPVNGKPQLFIENTPNAEGFTIHSLNAEQTPVRVEQLVDTPSASGGETLVPPTPLVEEISPAPSTESSAPVSGVSPLETTAEVAPAIPPTEVTEPLSSESVGFAAEPSESFASELAPSNTETSVPDTAPSAPLESVANTLTTPRGLTLNLNEPSVYSYTDKKGHQILSLFGGVNDDARYAAAQKYIETHPGSTIRFQVTSKILETGVSKPVVVEWSSTEDGTPILIPPTQFMNEAPLPKIDPNVFEKKVDFVYKK